MKKFLFLLTVTLLLCIGYSPLHATVLVFTVSANGGTSFGPSNSKQTTSGLSSLVMTPNAGFLNLSRSAVDFQGDVSTVLITERPITDAVTDTIVESFDYRIRVAVQAPGVDPTTLGGAAPAFPYIEFRHTGAYTLTDIQEGSVTRTFNSTPYGGDFGGTGTSAQTLFLEGVGYLTLSFDGFCLPVCPQLDVLNGDYRGSGMMTYRLTVTPSVRISGRVTLQGAVNQAQPLTFKFQPNDNSQAFEHVVTPNADRTYSLPNVPGKAYTLKVKGTKWLAKKLSIDATQGDLFNIDFLLPVGDIDNDNSADIIDLLLLINAYNKAAPAIGYSESADFNDDGSNSIQDLLLLISNYNRQGD